MQYRGQANRDAAQRSAEDLSPAKRCAAPTEQDAAQLSAEDLSPAKRCAAPTEQDAAQLSAEDLSPARRCAAPTEQDAAQRSAEDIVPARRCAAPSCSAAMKLQNWASAALPRPQSRQALRRAQLLCSNAAALQLHRCRAGCSTALSGRPPARRRAQPSSFVA
ncbi:hypothetical protein PCANC_18833 [Puccinia coronata f. sp. avenae]|uniref:Uncharacterized protein n=1 Tax=Puccinia coronata f. sp. avenae TaxID=200324 RepID=A0A2N5U4V5_9BASI|nr:hypothetical protein PCANC_18833 [Puccinia coronata f. sp. avenae]